MKKTMKKIVLIAAFAFLFSPVFFFALEANAGTTANLGLEYAANLGLTNTQQDPRELAVNIVKFLLTFLGIIAVVVILYGGFVWLTAGGNEDRVGKAKKLIIAGVIGLVIVLAAFAIVTFVIDVTNQLIESGTYTG